MNRLITRNPTRYKTITADNGCEFHGYRRIEYAFEWHLRILSLLVGLLVGVLSLIGLWRKLRRRR